MKDLSPKAIRLIEWATQQEDLCHDWRLRELPDVFDRRQYGIAIVVGIDPDLKN